VAVVLLYYALTMARDLSFYDSAELALVAVQGGLGHPLGQPLHTWLGWVFARLPGLPPLLGLNLLSAVATALTVIPLVSLAEGMMRTSRRSPSPDPQPRAPAAPASTAASAGDPASVPSGDPAPAPAGDPASAPAGDPASAPAGDSASAPAGDPAPAPERIHSSAPAGDHRSAPAGDSGPAPDGDPASVPARTARASPSGHPAPAPAPASPAPPEPAPPARPATEPSRAAKPRPWWRQDRVLLPAGVALLFVHPALWENGTRVEVYALAMLCGVWAVARVAATLAPRPLGGGGWIAAGAGLGLAASANAYMAAIAAAGLGPAVLWALWRRRLGARQLLRATGGGLLGLFPFVHIPLTAGSTDVFVWGAPTGGEALMRYLRNADFAHNRGLGLAGFVDHLGTWSVWAVEQGLWPLIGLGLIGHLLWGRRAGLGRLLAPMALGLTVTVLCINVIFWPQITDYLGYLSLPVSLLGVGAWVTVLRLARHRGIDRRLSGGLAALLVLVLLGSLALSPPAVHERTRHRDRLARVLAEGALADAPPDAILVISTDHWAFPLLYLQEVEKRRPDVVILPFGLSGASWYWAHLRRRHPGLAPFALRGPGGKVGRFRRFVRANPDRPVLYESFSLAVTLGRPGCPGRWLLRDRNACGHPGARGPDRLTRALRDQVARIGQGSPPAGRVIARVALQRGVILWRYGLPAAALRAFRAGVPPAHRPPRPGLDGGAAGRLRGPSLRWDKPVLIGHWSRNLYQAARLLHAAGASEAARAHLRTAAAAGLPEARN
jgi:hypothetical protein